MGATPTEITNFFWHCLVAARITDEFPDTTVTRSYRLYAVRKATDCWAGRNGVQYASDAAIAEKYGREEHGKRCGLTKEHVIPVGVVSGFVYDKLKATIASAGTVEPLVLSDHEAQELTPEVVNLFQQHPRAWIVARIIRTLTLHAWITEAEHKEFNKEGVGDCMPMGWTPDQDPFARYHVCRIKVSKI